MFKHLFVTVTLAGLAACQASRPLPTTGIYTTAAAFRQQRPSLRGAQVQPAFVGYQHVFLRKPAGSQAKRLQVGTDSIWGYCRANGTAYRTFQNRTYKIRQVDTLTIYSIKRGKTTLHYFSEGLTSPIQRLSKKMLQTTFASNAAFLHSLNQVKWYQSIEVPEPHSKGHSFRVVALYRQSLQLPH